MYIIAHSTLIDLKKVCFIFYRGQISQKLMKIWFFSYFRISARGHRRNQINILTIQEKNISYHITYQNIEKKVEWGHISPFFPNFLNFDHLHKTVICSKHSTRICRFYCLIWKWRKFAIGWWKNLGGGGGRFCFRWNFCIISGK